MKLKTANDQSKVSDIIIAAAEKIMRKKNLFLLLIKY